MAAVARFYPNAIGRLACDAVGAGADMVLVCGRPLSAVAAYHALRAYAEKHRSDYRVHAARIATLRGKRLPEPGTSTVPDEGGPQSSPDR